MAAILSWMKDTREYLTPQMTTSNFLERGMLTPDEFVRAGDQLVAQCPTWKWHGGEAAKRRPYLPANKQYLTTVGVNCYKRISHLKQYTVDLDIEGGMEGDKNENWVAPGIKEVTVSGDKEGGDGDEDDVVMISAADLSLDDREVMVKDDKEKADAARQVLSEADFEEEDPSLSLDAYTKKTISTTPSSSSSSASSSGDDDECAILKSRKYDLSISYDNYYRTPRIWLFGYDENGSVLTQYKVFEDIMSDYARKTVTFEPHPHESRLQATVHPCQHAAAMLRIINGLIDCGKIPSVEQYMTIFLKFMQSVIPTIEYDFTSDVDAGGR